MAVARTFVEDFADGQGGFYGWVGNQEGPKLLEHLPAEDGGALLSRSPWWIDYNHAPNPVGRGAGYLHMVYSYSTRGPIAELYAEVGGGKGGGEHTNSFVPFPLNRWLGHRSSMKYWKPALLRLVLKLLAGGRRCLATIRPTLPTP